ncbi:pyrimidine 5'-nucleotidase [Hyphomicrobium sp.]|uniref:pyrimidine 5'-nucleotidase n=1 Tax=Hyphomicrobium sp. TaxID=82 RepID=UPI0025BAE367|nr:pyrimidine 5'-nucleotidase [Hyphomicrobium sp.]MCC7253002.1 pyrimidine 5'-nucleotidase [Hyphomicrobium sp.]
MSAERKVSRAAADVGEAPRVLQSRSGAPPRGFAHTDAWIFDLDNTLYPAECNLFAQVDHRMGAFIAHYLGVSYAQARHLQKTYYRQFGTTLAGLMAVHKLDPAAFLAYVHDIDLSVVPEAPELRAAIAALPGRRLIYTNGSRRHAERVAEKLGVLDLFEDICDIAACDYVPKPEADAFQRMVRRHGVAAERAAMFEDMPMNLTAPHDLGMTTVLVHSSYLDHPVQEQMKTWTELPDHIHHMTLDLAEFLAATTRVCGDVSRSRPPPG